MKKIFREEGNLFKGKIIGKDSSGDSMVITTKKNIIKIFGSDFYGNTIKDEGWVDEFKIQKKYKTSPDWVIVEEKDIFEIEEEEKIVGDFKMNEKVIITFDGYPTTGRVIGSTGVFEEDDFEYIVETDIDLQDLYKITWEGDEMKEEQFSYIAETLEGYVDRYIHPDEGSYNPEYKYIECFVFVAPCNIYKIID